MNHFHVIDRVKSAQQLMGSIVKTYLPRKLGLDPGRVSHITLMPCFDKKLEASRDDFLDSETGIKDVDCVITTLEVEEMLAREACDLARLEDGALDSVVEAGTREVIANTGSASGGYSDHLFRRVISAPSTEI